MTQLSESTATLILLGCALFCANLCFAAEFKEGDLVTLNRDDIIYRSTPYFATVRKAAKGEQFTVVSYDASAKKLYVLEKGNTDVYPNRDTWIKPDAVVREASEVPGFLGIKWGTNSVAAKGAMLARSGVTLDPKKSRMKPHIIFLAFNGGTFAGKAVESFTLSFYDDKLFLARIDFPFDSGASVSDDLMKLLQAKYGVGNLEDVNLEEEKTFGRTWELRGGGSIYHTDSNRKVRIYYSALSIREFSNEIADGAKRRETEAVKKKAQNEKDL